MYENGVHKNHIDLLIIREKETKATYLSWVVKWEFILQTNEEGEKL